MILLSSIDGLLLVGKAFVSGLVTVPEWKVLKESFITEIKGGALRMFDGRR